MKRRTIWTLLIITIAVCAFSSCADNSINRLLDEYDKVIDDMLKYHAQETAQLSKLSGDSDAAKVFARIAAAQKEVEKYQKKIEVIGEKLTQYESYMTTEQTERLIRITFRMVEAVEAFQ
jgi:peptidoglycan hydrolase CwlO-like protein